MSVQERTLFRNGTVHTTDGHAAGAPSAVAVEEGLIVWVGDEDGASRYETHADRVVDLHGALLAPAFVDAHAHTVMTGFGLTRLDLHHTTTLVEALDLVSELAGLQTDGVVVATGWEEHSWPEGRPPTAEELDRAAPGRMVLLERRDCHSSVVSSALIEAVPGLEGTDGFSADGRLERDARKLANDALAELVGADQRLVAARAAVQLMAAHGIAGFHEAAAPHLGPTYELELVRHAAAQTGLEPTIYWGELDAFDMLEEHEIAGLAGDLNVDGAIGSRTAALHSHYDDRPETCGHRYLDAETVARHLVACTRAGVQGGFHCIGDAGLETLADGLLLAEKEVGAEALRACRHRFEHVEMPSQRLIETMARLGVLASMQPAFDDLWGGPDRMYAARLGERWRGMNPVGSLSRAGVAMAFGSDTPVTPVDPWAAVRAAVEHRDEGQRVSPEVAFEAHTVGGWYAARIDGVGRIQRGAPAHLAVWDCPGGLDGTLPALGTDVPLPSLRELYVHGMPVEEP